MSLSRSTRIILLLTVDVLFFFIELIAGYAVGSLALVADSFHMLNDVMSLIVALYAIKLSRSEASPKYSYGWHRAEIVAALINGVFLLALCFSIFMEAMERFFSTPDISNPKLIVIVGSFGLASNFLGLFLFHEHSHDHSHESHPASAQPTSAATKSANKPGVLPLTTNDLTTDGDVHSHGASRSSHRDSFTNLYGYPAATRASLVQTAQNLEAGTSVPRTERYYDNPPSDEANDANPGAGSNANEETLGDDMDEGVSGPTLPNVETPMTAAALGPRERDAASHGHGHGHSHSRSSGGHSHAGSMNMRALVLHVIGDALGNVGVIATGLVIWLSTWEYRYYFDPVISLVITVIIFSSAMPLVRSAAFILLQAVPSTISLQDLRIDIQNVSGVLSVHELHVWQLSETKIIASVHVWVSRKREYMHIAQDIRHVLHEHGVHSTTIQPEFHNGSGFVDGHNAPDHVAGHIDEEQLVTNEETHCLIPCPPGVCDPESGCCPPQKPSSLPNSKGPSPPLIDVQ